MSEFNDVTDVSKKALAFQKLYYTGLDSGMDSRGQLLGMYLDPTDGSTLMQWNGHSIANVEGVSQYFQNLPPTKHEVKSLDAQPLPGNQQGDSFLVTVNGKCTYDDEHVRLFFQRFVLHKAEQTGKFYIVNDYLRWTGEEFH